MLHRRHSTAYLLAFVRLYIYYYLPLYIILIMTWPTMIFFFAPSRQVDVEVSSMNNFHDLLWFPKHHISKTSSFAQQTNKLLTLIRQYVNHFLPLFYTHIIHKKIPYGMDQYFLISFSTVYNSEVVSSWISIFKIARNWFYFYFLPFFFFFFEWFYRRI